MDVNARPDLITAHGATTVPWFVYNLAQSFAGPLPELLLTQRLLDLAGTNPGAPPSY